MTDAVEVRVLPSLYGFIRVLLIGLMKALFRLRVEGAENIPSTGGVILACNHASYLDPPFIGATVRNRLVRFMARDSLFKVKFLAWFYYRFGVVAIDRTRGDVGAIKKAVRLLKDGECVALFPEGTRTLDGNLQEAKGGIGFLIQKSGVPVVPVYIDGSYTAWPKGAKRMKFTRVRAIYGPAISPQELEIKDERGRVDFNAVAALVMSRIAALVPANR